MSRGFSVIPAKSSLVLLGLLFAVPMFASRPYAVENRAVAKLRAGGNRIVIDQIPLFDGNPGKLTLERFEVWAPDVQIIEYDANRGETRYPRPATRFYKGSISGDPGSLVFVSVQPDGEINGMALASDGVRKLSIGRGRRVGPPAERGERREDLEPPLLVREFDEVDDLTAAPAGGFRCDVEGKRMSIARSLAELKPKPEMNSSPSVSTAYGLNLAIETDGEEYAAFGSTSALTAYISDLVGKASVIYQRDLKTTLTVGTLHTWTSASTDPWTVVPPSATDAALAEMGTYWHNNYASVNRSSVVFVSGKAFFGGIAWTNQLCAGDFFCGASGLSCGSATFANSYAGGYAFCGSTVVTTLVPDPTLTVNTIQYALPNNNNFWMLLELVHELGHNANGPHTHCVALNSTQKATYGVTRDYVDICYNGEGGCYAGATTSYPSELGTIMSYCHNLNTTLNNPPGVAAGFPASRYIFGKAGEPSELVLPYLTTGLESGTPNGAITVGTNLPCTAGQSASIAAATSMSWSITGGSITSGTTGSSITFTPSSPSVTLTCTVANTKGCSLTSQVVTTTQCAALAAPTSVVAAATSATSIQVSWSGSCSTECHIYRSSDRTTFTRADGGGVATSPFTDTVSATPTAYLYKVRAFNGSESGDSNTDLATSVIYTDDPLIGGTTVAKAVHLTQLRTAVDAVRKLANNGVASPFSYTDGTITAGSTLVKAVHVTDLRTALDAAMTTLGLTTGGFTDGSLSGIAVKAVHFQEMRNRMK